MNENVKKLMFFLQEEQFPYFVQDEGDYSQLEYLLSLYPNVFQSAYEGCMIKSSNDSVSLGPINTPSNREYWLGRATHFYRCWQDDINKPINNGRHTKSQGNYWSRADEY